MNGLLAHGGTRPLQLGFLALLVVCIAQLAYWMVDEYRYTDTIRARSRSQFEASAALARELVRAGAPWERVALEHAELTRAPNGTIGVSAAALAQLDSDRFHRLNRYTWEGAFFLCVLLAAMSVVYSAIREESTLRQQQDLFLAAASHELRSPLTSLRLSAETLALRDPPAHRRHELVLRVQADLARLERTITNLLQASRLAGSARLVREQFSLAVEVSAVADELRLLADETGVRIETNVPHDLTLYADREGVHTVVRNLVHNAIKASRGAGADATVTVSAAREGDDVRLDVRDPGMGFAPSEAGRLFRKFYRIEQTGAERLPGTGLGLYLVRRCVDLEGGSAQASSDGPGRGACFTARWPALAPREA